MPTIKVQMLHAMAHVRTPFPSVQSMPTGACAFACTHRAYCDRAVSSALQALREQSCAPWGPSVLPRLLAACATCSHLLKQSWLSELVRVCVFSVCVRVQVCACAMLVHTVCIYNGRQCLPCIQALSQGSLVIIDMSTVAVSPSLRHESADCAGSHSQDHSADACRIS